MSRTVVFVHGTGVREEGYESSYKLIKQQLKTTLQAKAAPCYWGTETGARLLANGASIPKYATTGGGTVDQKDQDLARWTILYADPWYELRLIADATFPKTRRPPGTKQPDVALDDYIRGYTPSETFTRILRRAYFSEHWERARNELLDSAEYKRALLSVGDNNVNHLRVLARAHVAKMMVLAHEKYVPTIDGALRDELVTRLQSEFKADTRGATDWLKKPFIGIAGYMGKKWATSRILQKRGEVTDLSLALPTDIILYQTRGQPIRDFIEQAIKDAPANEVTVLAHSLGGIAAVDLLISKDIEKVTSLITVGSQAPLMYELNCLSSLAYGKPLPAHFPPWLNIYDRRDALSYIGSGLFQGRVKDVEVNNGQPFPESHSAYWSNPAVWAAVADF